MATVKVFVTVTTVEPLSHKDSAKFRPTRTPRVLEAGQVYDVEPDVADKLIEFNRADKCGEPGVPSSNKGGANQLANADRPLTPEEMKAQKGAGGMAMRNTLGKDLKDKGDKKEADESDTDQEGDESEVPSEDWELGDLKAYAEDNDIDIKGARTKSAILEKIEEAEGE